MKTNLENFEFIEVPELGIKITTETQFRGVYSAILKEVSEDKIATDEILQKLRNIAFESNWKKYSFMKDFWVYVPNLDEASKKEGYVTWLHGDSKGILLNHMLEPSEWSEFLGVFLYEKIK